MCGSEKELKFYHLNGPLKNKSVYNFSHHLSVRVFNFPSCTQEYKWRELEEQRQAQKLQRQLQQEQAYLLSLQQNQNLDSNKTAQQQSIKPPQNPEQDRINPPQSPEPDTAKQPQSTDLDKTQNRSLEKTTEPKQPVADLQGPAPDSEPVREVIPRSSLPSH